MIAEVDLYQLFWRRAMVPVVFLLVNLRPHAPERFLEQKPVGDRGDGCTRLIAPDRRVLVSLAQIATVGAAVMSYWALVQAEKAVEDLQFSDQAHDQVNPATPRIKKPQARSRRRCSDQRECSGGMGGGEKEIWRARE